MKLNMQLIMDWLILDKMFDRFSKGESIDITFENKYNVIL